MEITQSQTELDLIGDSEAIRRISRDVDLAARSDAKVLITGESGVGKDVVAQLIHQKSARRLSRLAIVNCAGVPDSLLESELFGHVRGSFTGAYRDKPGLLEAAPHGTVFLDEVGEMSVRMQAVLLRFLETGELQRVGADRVHARANTRVIAATNRDLEAEITAGRFREDLYYRLNVIRIHVPALRERPQDIPALANHFLRMCTCEHRILSLSFSPDALEALVAHDWPGNVRQLKNIVERMALKASGRTLEARDLPTDIGPTRSTVDCHGAPGLAESQAEAMERALMRRMIDDGESFWTVVYEPFMLRDLMRTHVKSVVGHGLSKAGGSYRLLLPLFGMPPTDYRRLLTFLRKFDCYVPLRGPGADAPLRSAGRPGSPFWASAQWRGDSKVAWVAAG